MTMTSNLSKAVIFLGFAIIGTAIINFMQTQELRKMENRLVELERYIANVDSRSISEIEMLQDTLEERIGSLEAEMDSLLFFIGKKPNDD